VLTPAADGTTIAPTAMPRKPRSRLRRIGLARIDACGLGRSATTEVTRPRDVLLRTVYRESWRLVELSKGMSKGVAVRIQVLRI
jgi:hypothetical protein